MQDFLLLCKLPLTQPTLRGTVKHMGSLIRVTVSSYGEESVQPPLAFQGNSEEMPVITLGQQAGDWKIPSSSLSNPHIWFIFKKNQWFVQEIDTLQGAYIRVPDRALLQTGTWLRMGRQYWQVVKETSVPPDLTPEGTQSWQGVPLSPCRFRLVQYLGPKQRGHVFCSSSPSVTVGQQNSDIHLPEDDFLSSPHLRISEQEEGFLVEDLRSLRGSYVRVQSPHPLRHKDTLLLGEHLLQIETGSGTL